MYLVWGVYLLPGGVPGLGDVPGLGGVPGPGGCTWSLGAYLGVGVGVPGPKGVYLVWGRSVCSGGVPGQGCT